MSARSWPVACSTGASSATRAWSSAFASTSVSRMARCSSEPVLPACSIKGETRGAPQKMVLRRRPQDVELRARMVSRRRALTGAPRGRGRPSRARGRPSRFCGSGAAAVVVLADST